MIRNSRSSSAKYVCEREGWKREREPITCSDDTIRFFVIYANITFIKVKRKDYQSTLVYDYRGLNDNGPHRLR